MKTPFSPLSLIVVLAALSFFTGCLQNNSTSDKATSTQPQAEPVATPDTNTTDEEAPALAEQEDQQALSTAAVRSLSNEKPVPPEVRLNRQIQEILRLSDAGVDAKVMLTYVTNSAISFNLGADEIIYLNDLGIPSDVVTAMIERDRALKEALVHSLMPDTFGTETQPEPVPTPVTFARPAEPAPTPFEAATPIDYSTEPYPPPTEPYPDTAPAPVAYEQFYDSLAPYGSWVDLDGYGRCWQPSVVVIHRNWRPYCDGGRWAYTDCGWYWLSDYSWGWAPFHYGRWFQHTRLGWCWAPDNVWGPSWVSWRYSDDYCGWAPLPPRACYTTAGFTYYGRSVSASFSFGLNADCYTFVPFHRFHEHHLSRHRIAHDQANHVFHKTVASTSFGRNQDRITNNGLNPDKVAAATQRPVHRTTVREVTSSTRNSGRTDPSQPDGRTLSVHRLSLRQPAAPASPATASLPVPEVGQAGPVPSPARRTWTASAPRQSASEPTAVQNTILHRPASSSPATDSKTITSTEAPAPQAPEIRRFPPRTVVGRRGTDAVQQPQPLQRQPTSPSWLVRSTPASSSHLQEPATVPRPTARQNAPGEPTPPQTVIDFQNRSQPPVRASWGNHPQHSQPRSLAAADTENASAGQSSVTPSPSIPQHSRPASSLAPQPTRPEPVTRPAPSWTPPSHQSSIPSAPPQRTHSEPSRPTPQPAASSPSDSSAHSVQHNPPPAAPASSPRSSQSSSERSESRSDRSESRSRR